MVQKKINPKKHLFCFGTGYVIKYLEKNYLSTSIGIKDYSISGTSRTPQETSTLKSPHIISFSDTVSIKEKLKNTSNIIISTPPSSKGCPTFLAHAEILQDSAPSHIPLVYLSATSVYGNHYGAFVNEQAPCTPTSQSGHNRVKAERQWQSFCKAQNRPCFILRLSGIYGPGRNILERLEKITKHIHKPGHTFSRIHVHDICQVIEKILTTHKKIDRNTSDSTKQEIISDSFILNLADDLPAPSKDLIEYACDLLNRPYPPLIDFEKASLSPRAKEFYQDNKKVSNSSLKKFLGSPLCFPTYKDGLQDILKAKQKQVLS